MKKVMFVFMTLIVFLSTIYFTDKGIYEIEIPYLNGVNVQTEGMISPLDPKSGFTLTSPFGMRFHPILQEYKMHGGVDLSVPTGTPLYSPTNSKVSTIGYDSTSGNYVKLTHEGDEIQTVYVHLDSVSVIEGQSLLQGQEFAKTGNTGLSTGPHLHFEVRVWNGDTYERKDPEKYFDFKNIQNLPAWTYPDMIQAPNETPTL